MLAHVLSPELQRLGPLVFLGDDVYAISRQQGGSAALVTARGVAHPMRRLCASRTLVEHHRQANGAAVRRHAEAELARLNAASATDPLAYFILHLAPTFLARDWSEERAADWDEPVESAARPDLSRQLDDLVVGLPVPTLPSPALAVLGRVWLLYEGRPSSGRMYVSQGASAFSLTGEHVSVGALADEWRAEATHYISGASALLAAVAGPATHSDRLARASGELSRSGCLRFGDLIFLAGSPPRVGHVIPPHNNRTLGYRSERDLAVTAPLSLPPKVGALSIYRQTGAAAWTPVSLPHGLCLGKGAPGQLRDDPGLALAAHLRWAAARLAANGRFHERD